MLLLYLAAYVWQTYFIEPLHIRRLLRLVANSRERNGKLGNIVEQMQPYTPTVWPIVLSCVVNFGVGLLIWICWFVVHFFHSPISENVSGEEQGAEQIALLHIAPTRSVQHSFLCESPTRNQSTRSLPLVSIAIHQPTERRRLFSLPSSAWANYFGRLIRLEQLVSRFNSAHPTSERSTIKVVSASLIPPIAHQTSDDHLHRSVRSFPATPISFHMPLGSGIAPADLMRLLIENVLSFRVAGIAGFGGSSVVFNVTRPLYDKQFVLKMVDLRGNYCSSFFSEHQAFTKLKCDPPHENVVQCIKTTALMHIKRTGRVFACDDVNELQRTNRVASPLFGCFFMPHLGVSLDTFQEIRWNTMNREQKLHFIDRLSVDICSAYAFLNERGILYDDLHNNNVLTTFERDSHGVPQAFVLIDFGLAQCMHEEDLQLRRRYEELLDKETFESVQGKAVDGNWRRKWEHVYQNEVSVGFYLLQWTHLVVSFPKLKKQLLSMLTYSQRTKLPISVKWALQQYQNLLKEENKQSKV